ncbi:MAG: hypothetical protein Greene041679_272, partial [Parcubacteria group bacterium Greene0416_79]
MQCKTMAHDRGHNLNPQTQKHESSFLNHESGSYSCPMHPEVVSDKPGLCPECGMALLETRINADKNAGKRGYISVHQHQHNHKRTSASLDKHAGHSTNIFKRKFLVSLLLTIPILLYSEVAEMLLGFRLPELKIENWELKILVPTVLGTAVFFYGGWIFIIGAYRELRARLPGMMTLIALAITAAYFFSISVVLSGGTKTLFWELSTLVVIMLLGHWIEMRAVSGAQSALKELSKLLPDTAERFKIYDLRFKNEDRETEIVPLTALQVGDKVLVKPGARVPADGKVVSGHSDVNESLLTGESKPVRKKEQDEVIAGAQNGDGALIVEVQKIGEATFLSGINRLVAEAQASKSRLQMLADRAARLLTIIAGIAGGLTLGTGLLLGAAVVAAMSCVV